MTGKANGAPAKSGPCPTCGVPFAFRKGTVGYVPASSGVFTRSLVCPECASHGILIVPFADAHDVRAVLRPFATHLRHLAKAYEKHDEARAAGLTQAADVLAEGRAVAPDGAAPARLVQVPGEAADGGPIFAHSPPPAAATPRNRSASRCEVFPSSSAMPRLNRALLTVLVQRDAKPANRKQLAILSGYSPNSGTYAEGLTQLRTAGFIEGPASAITLTDAGRAAVGPVEELPRGDALLAYWCKRVGPCGDAVLHVVTAAHPKALSRDEIATRTGYSTRSGSFASTLTLLRAMGLLDGFRASDDLMTALKGDH